MKNNKEYCGPKTFSEAIHNMEFLGFIFCVLGSLMNFLVLLVNGGKMPVVCDKKITSTIHKTATEKSRFLIFADWIKIKIDNSDVVKKFIAIIAGIPIGRKILASPGDLFIFASRIIIFLCFIFGIIVSLFGKDHS